MSTLAQRIPIARQSPGHALGLDQALIWVTVALLAWGLIMVYSASIAMPENPKFSRYTHTHFLLRHGVSIAVAFVAALIAFQIPIETWEKAAPWLFVVSLILLIVVSRRSWRNSPCCFMPLTTWCARWR